MKNMTLNNIAIACRGKLFTQSTIGESEVKGVVIDSRLIEKDFLFIATRGEKVDGHDYIEAASSQGAIAVICERAPSNKTISYILVEDSLLALKDIAS